VDNSEVYAVTRRGLLDLAAGLDDDQAALPVSACPGWTVKDVFAHLTGVAVDVPGGRAEGAGTAEWTARQVGERAGDRLPDVCAEWAGAGPKFEEWMAAAEPPRTMFAAFDVWTHEQDVRAAVGLRGLQDRRVGYLAGLALTAFDRRFTEAGALALHVTGDGVDCVLGEGEAEASLRIAPYELLRTLFGRRSVSQMEAAGWSGDPAPYLEHLHLFVLPEHDLTD
jgi:uncharacterized protein (TIGR03083 family)